eukprot:GHVU01206061.1.p1 GENE.GHVU01206061.1~~GHVU01206061.1.p1  ORF type:complete len:110 (-),score=4.82 GHVU01206061.1:105-434(-)
MQLANATASPPMHDRPGRRRYATVIRITISSSLFSFFPPPWEPTTGSRGRVGGLRECGDEYADVNNPSIGDVPMPGMMKRRQKDRPGMDVYRTVIPDETWDYDTRNSPA